MIWSDKSQRSIVVGCSSCPSFRRLASSPGEVEQLAQAHLSMCHPPKDAAVKRAVTASRARQRRSDTP